MRIGWAGKRIVSDCKRGMEMRSDGGQHMVNITIYTYGDKAYR